MKKKRTTKAYSSASGLEKINRIELRSLSEKFQQNIDTTNWNLNNSALFTNRQSLSRILFFNEIYKLIIGKPGSIIEFGVQFGSTLSLLTKLRGIYEPYNYSRKIFGFDTFKGFPKKFNKSEKKVGWKKGDYTTGIVNYEKFLEKVLLNEEKNAPLSHIKKFELIKGDATKTFPKFLKKNPQLIPALVIFDMDLYYPTKSILKRILPRLFKGSVIVFDEINCDYCPGETQAILDILKLKEYKLRSFHGQTFSSYVVIDKKK